MHILHTTDYETIVNDGGITQLYYINMVNRNEASDQPFQELKHVHDTENSGQN